MREAPLPSPASAHTPDDATLVLRTLNGAREAFGELVTRYQRPLYRHALGLGLDHDTAVDLVQDACVKAWSRLADCRDPAAFRAWLFRILRNLCLDHHKDRRRQAVSLSTLPEAVEIVDPGTLGDGVTHLALRAALHAVPPMLREAFLLKHDAGYSYDEIAAIVAATPSAVKMRVHRARELLREHLDLADPAAGPLVVR